MLTLLNNSPLHHCVQGLARALHYLHTHPSGVIIHRDLKAQNCLVELSQKRIHIIRLCDFGVSKQLLEEADKAATQIGSDFWMAPEVHEGKDAYDEKSDVWSYAMVLLEMLTLEHPYHGVARDVAISHIQRGVQPSLTRYQRKSPKICKLIQVRAWGAHRAGACPARLWLLPCVVASGSNPFTLPPPLLPSL